MQSQPLKPSVAQRSVKEGDESMKVLINAVVLGSELEKALETSDPLTLAVDRFDVKFDPRDDGRE